LQNLRHRHRAVGLLIIFHQSGDDSRRGNGRVVERVSEAEFACLVTIADVQTTRLKIVKVRSGVGLAIGLLRRQPNFQIIFFHLTQTEVGTAIENHAVRQTERLEQAFGVRGNFLMPLDARLVTGFANHHLFQFEKLVDANQTFGVLAVTAGLAAEAGREGEKLLRQLGQR